MPAKVGFSLNLALYETYMSAKAETITVRCEVIDSVLAFSTRKVSRHAFYPLTYPNLSCSSPCLLYVYGVMEYISPMMMVVRYGSDRRDSLFLFNWSSCEEVLLLRR